MADFDRFRSFAERYVIERASSFRTGYEQDDAWTAILDAKAVYHQISEQAKYMDKPEQAGIMQAPSQGGGQQAGSSKPQQVRTNPYGAAQLRAVVAVPPSVTPALGLRSYVRNILNGGQA